MKHLKNFSIYQLILEAQQSLKFNVPKDVLDLHKLFKKNRKELYVVGGAVRDALMGKKPKDFDLATDAHPDEVVNILIKGGYETIGEVGQQFGVVIVKTPKFREGMEIATFREDIGKGRRPDAVTYSTIDLDVKRRDLTINALFYDIDKKEVVDLVGGVADIQSNTIRTVGRAQERFDEDPLRKLRALRFAGRTGGNVDKNVAEALIEDNSLENISAERIRDEFKKSVESAKSVKHYYSLLDKFNFWGVMFPNLEINKPYIESKYWILNIAQLFMKNDRDLLKKLLNKYTFSNDEVQSVIFLKDLLDITPENVFELYKAYSNTKLDKRIILGFAMFNKLDVKIIKAFLKYKPSISGKDVIKKYNLRGPEIGQKIKELEAEEFSKLYENKTYNDYPAAAKKNAQQAIDWKEKYGRDEVDAGMRVGWARAHQLAKGESLSVDTIKRMASFNRHRKNSKISADVKDTPWKDRGYVAWLLWGGDEGVDWAIKKSKQLENES